MVRPSYVLGGRAMEIVHRQADLERYMREAVKVSNDSPVLLDRFLDHASEIDVDCICDGREVLVGITPAQITPLGTWRAADAGAPLPPQDPATFPPEPDLRTGGRAPHAVPLRPALACPAGARAHWATSCCGEMTACMPIISQWWWTTPSWA